MATKVQPMQARAVCVRLTFWFIVLECHRFNVNLFRRFVSAHPGVMRAVSGKLSELEVELQRSQRSIDIPLVKLEINRQIAAVCKTVRTTLVFLSFFLPMIHIISFFFFSSAGARAQSRAARRRSWRSSIRP